MVSWVFLAAVAVLFGVPVDPLAWYVLGVLVVLVDRLVLFHHLSA